METSFHQSTKLHFLYLGLIRDVDRQKLENAEFEMETSPSVLFWATKGVTWFVLWCRGRARAHGSHYVLMLERGNRDHELLLSQVVG